MRHLRIMSPLGILLVPIFFDVAALAADAAQGGSAHIFYSPKVQLAQQNTCALDPDA